MLKKLKDDIFISGYNGKSFDEKSSYWGQWSSKGGSFPSEIDDIITQINVNRNLDVYAKYGFKVAYYMFMENWGKEETEEYFKVDDSYRIYGT